MREAIRIERLTRAHRREDFDCGEPPLNGYLQRLALQHDERRLGRTYVAVEEPSDGRILGYYTLATGRVAFETVPSNKKLPPGMAVPVILLGRLAVDQSQKGKGLGRLLLMHPLWRCAQIGAQAGVYAVEVDALHPDAAAFYERYGFVRLLDDPLHLYLPMRTIESLGLDSDEVSGTNDA